MQIRAETKLEDCFDGSAVFGFRFEEPWTRDGIATLGALGELEYFADFPRPFFRVRGPGGLEVKGVEGERDCRVALPSKDRELVRARVREHFSRIEPAAR
jgi:hypothetical protein